ncbi:SWPV1-121 [Shearwaterpox virus]|uniref:SWPV1-121 n=1 Tax=Shearwaterpox virus TaxID=1974596 RepID=A0A1V0S7W2_CNPV|nr:SWPV1-121 [Shearwaterpox virus]
MDVSCLDQLLSMHPFSDMDNVIINEKENCILGNRCFVKISEVYNMPMCCINTKQCFHMKKFTFSLGEILYSPFHYKQLQYQYLMPQFIFKCIEEANERNMSCYYCSTKKKEHDSLNIDIFIPTINSKSYIVIGLRIKDFWKQSFKVNKENI